MKIKSVLLTLLLISLWSCQKDNGAAPDCLSANLLKGLVAYYPFNEGSLEDRSANNYDLRNPTAAQATSDKNGAPNCAFAFDNSIDGAEYLTTSATSFLNDFPSFSISLWYQPIDTTRNRTSYEILISRGDKGHCPDRRGEWTIGLYDCRRAVWGHNNSVWAKSVSDPDFNCEQEIKDLTGQWHHVVAVKTADQYQIYFSGVLSETKNGNALCTNPYLAQDIGDLLIGKYYTGKIDEILLYNRTLLHEDVKELYRHQSCCGQ